VKAPRALPGAIALLAIAALPLMAERLRPPVERCGMDGVAAAPSFRVRVAGHVFCGVTCAESGLARSGVAPAGALVTDGMSGRAIDAREAYVGGFNLHRESSRAAFGPGRWRDTQVRMSGALAEEAAALFDAFWNGHHRWPAGVARGTGDALVPNDSRVCRHQVHCLYLRLLRGAERRLYLTTPYFVPDHGTQNELVQAARRQVDVRLLLPGKSDVPITQWAAHAAYSTLLSGGVRVFEYQPRMLHAKTAVIDGAVATVGTANLDYRSLFVNYELNLFSGSDTLCAALESQFLADLAESKEVKARDWSRRAWPRLVAESVGWMARRWL